MKRNLSSLLLFPVFLALTLFAHGQNAAKVDAAKYFDENRRWYNEYTEHWFNFFDIPEEEVRNSIIHWEKIGADLEKAKEQWAGTFFSGGETHGDYFRWSEKSGFVWLKVNKCAGGPMQIIRGRVIVNSNQIQLLPEHKSGTEHHGHGEYKKNQEQIDLLFVKWRGVPFLVPQDAISDFADFTAGLGRYNESYSYMLGDISLFGNPYLQKFGIGENENNNELPIFPAGYEKFVKKPIKGQIISIGKSFRQPDPNEFNAENWENLVIPVRINVGKAHGVVPNLRFIFVNAKSSHSEELIVKKVEENSSLVEIIRSVRKKSCIVAEDNTCENFDYAKIKVGLKISTTGY